MVVLHAAGDVWMAKRSRAGECEGFLKVLDTMRQADIAFANLEAPISDRGFASEKYACLRSDPSLAGELGEMGLDIVSLANNHAMDYGSEAILDTIDVLDRRGIKHVGAGRNLDEALSCALFGGKGPTLAFLAFS